MRLQEKAVTPFPKEIAHAIDAYADEFIEISRRNDVAENLNDQLENKFVKYIAEQDSAAQSAAMKRIGKISYNSCFYCGSDSGLVLRCDCGFGESFRCSDVGIRICKTCASAHCTVASVIREMLKHPRVNRVSSRRFQNWRILSEAAESIDEKAVEDGRVDLADTLYCALCGTEDVPWEASTAELRRVLFKSFRRVRFTRFQELAAAIERGKQDHLMRSAARLLRFLR